MVHISRETSEETHRRLLGVIAAATLQIYEGSFAFEELPLHRTSPQITEETLALVRDDAVWSRLVPSPARGGEDYFGLLRFHFPPEMDNSGFVGWLASHLKRELGTGVFVVCGQNSERGGIFDYWGFPMELRDEVLGEVERLRRLGASGPPGEVHRPS
jgi:hypothetical protein